MLDKEQLSKASRIEIVDLENGDKKLKLKTPQMLENEERIKLMEEQRGKYEYEYGAFRNTANKLIKNIEDSNVISITFGKDNKVKSYCTNLYKYASQSSYDYREDAYIIESNEEIYDENGKIKSICESSMEIDYGMDYEDNDNPKIREKMNINTDNMELGYTKNNEEASIEIKCIDNNKKISLKECLEKYPEQSEQFERFNNFVGIDCSNLELDEYERFDVKTDELNKLRKEEINKRIQSKRDIIKDLDEKIEIARKYYDEKSKNIEEKKKDYDVE